jgi:hypothetical protein
MSVAMLRQHANAHQFSDGDLDWLPPFDRAKWLLCPTLTPLYYTPAYASLTEPQQRRYNQLAGLATNEIVGFFERMLQPIFVRLHRHARVPADLRALLPTFLADECRHADIWWKLNRLAEPRRYADTEFRIVRFAWPVRRVIDFLLNHPVPFPVVVWTTLILEEHSLEITRRASRAAVPIEPRFAAAYKLHAQDEARHVQIDWKILELLLARLSPAMLRLNVRLLRGIVERCFLRPVTVATRVVRQLVDECPELRPREAEMNGQLAALSTSASYREMIFSPRANPITFALIRRVPAAREAFADLM